MGTRAHKEVTFACTFCRAPRRSSELTMWELQTGWIRKKTTKFKLCMLCLRLPAPFITERSGTVGERQILKTMHYLAWLVVDSKRRK